MIREALQKSDLHEQQKIPDNRLEILRDRLDSQLNPTVCVAGSAVRREEEFWKPERVDIFIAPATPHWRADELNKFSWEIVEGLYSTYFLAAHVNKNTLYLPYAGFVREKGRKTTYTNLSDQDEEFLRVTKIPYEEEMQMTKGSISQMIDIHFYPELSIAERAKEIQKRMNEEHPMAMVPDREKRLVSTVTSKDIQEFRSERRLYNSHSRSLFSRVLTAATTRIR